MTKAEQLRRKTLADGMTPAQQRRAVLIAEDVLKWLRTRRLVVEEGSYITFFNEDEEPAPGEALQPALATLVTSKKPCTVCALGACLIAKIDRFNAVDMPQWGFGRTATVLRLEDIFSSSQQDLIEAAFELRDVAERYVIDDLHIDAAIAFGGRFDDARKRLRAIMRNIIANRGVFVPPAITEAA